MHVAGLTMTDSEIQHEVLRELGWDARLQKAHVGVEVEHGVATLIGTIDSYATRAAAQQAARRVIGVLDVANDLRVDPSGELDGADGVNGGSGDQGRVSAETIRTEIEQALERRAERHARHIQIDVNGDRVSLSGPVQSWAEREAIYSAARYAAGVRRVEDRMHVAPAS
jgi:osmotically-inducible protein OsmY